MVVVCKDKITRHLKNGKKELGFYLDGKLKENLDFEVKRVKKKWDCIFIIDGEEGSAKSTLGSAIAYYMSYEFGTTFDIKDVVYTSEQFLDWIDNSPPYSVCLFDEFVLAGMSSDALTKIQNTLIKKMTVMRKKRLVVILVIPYFFMLRKYFAIARTRCLIHVYSPNNLDRGRFEYYCKPNKRMLYMKGEKYWEYNVWGEDFFGSFTDTTGLFYDMDAYETKKDLALSDIGRTKAEEKETKYQTNFVKVIEYLKGKKYTWDQLGEILDMKGDSLSKQIKRYYEKKMEKNRLNALHSPETKKLKETFEKESNTNLPNLNPQNTLGNGFFEGQPDGETTRNSHKPNIFNQK